MNNPDSPFTQTSDWSTQPESLRAIHARLLRVVPAIAQTLRPEASFAECGGDSLDFVELLCAIESDYGVRLTTDEIAALTTVKDLLECIESRAVRHPAP